MKKKAIGIAAALALAIAVVGAPAAASDDAVTCFGQTVSYEVTELYDGKWLADWITDYLWAFGPGNSGAVELFKLVCSGQIPPP